MADEEEETPQERLRQKHKKEEKELRAKIQSMKHSVPKGDKKKKKEVTLDIARLEEELKERFKRELEELSEKHLPEASNSVSDVTEMIWSVTVTEPQTRISKAQKRRDKKAAKEREREQRIAEAEMENVHSARNVENEKLKEILVAKGLAIKEINPDGHCLYNAIADQLSRQKQQMEMKTLRRLAAEFMQSHEEDFLPFLTDAKTGDSFTLDQYAQYCEEIMSTAAWGGHLEIQALSQALKIPIDVYQANTPMIRTGEEYDCQPILLSYHHHAYSLGEHYNSVIPSEESLER
ncbi:deubiquitinase OTUD6B-like isoform X2 [Acropora palmata]|uniref:deubiquitinase OTUD6B-like isoform X2 n=2 Tax=Acropora palmata TaxID=6131 RepID=UPI003DA079B6